jgi:hypothetical protein
VGTGAAWGDYDKDGDLDLYVTSYGGPHHLYRNNGEGTFTDVAAAAGVAAAPFWGSGVTFVDYDNDGDLDLYVLSWGTNVLYQNNGDGTFANVTAAAGVGGDFQHWQSAAWGDYDNDGFLDVYVTNHRFCQIYPTSPDRFYHNNGDGTFTEVTSLLNNAGPQTQGFGFAPGWLDYDNDGDPDLYLVADDLKHEENHYPNVLWRNDGPDGQGGWLFTDVSAESSTDLSINGMGLAIGDYNNDGNLDMGMSNTWSNMLLHNNGDGTFQNVTREAGVARGVVGTAPSITWGIGFFDFNNDVYQDLYIVAGYLKGFMLAEPNALFLNNGDGTFTDVSAESGADDSGRGRTAAFADYDGDGFVDIFVANFGEPPLLYHNDGPGQGNGHHWIEVELEGTVSNRNGVGAKVRVSAGGLTQLRQVQCGDSLGAGSDMAVHFGLGEATQVEQIEVVWPSGRVQVLTEVPLDRRITITEE